MAPLKDVEIVEPELSDEPPPVRRGFDDFDAVGYGRRSAQDFRPLPDGSVSASW